MNKNYKRIEAKITNRYYEETFLITNEGTYSEPYLTLNYPSLSPDGRLRWYEGKIELGEEDIFGEDIYPNQYDVQDEELQHIINEVYDILERNIFKIYNNPDKQLEIDGMKIETTGIANDYVYNQ